MKKLGVSILFATICISRYWAGDEAPTLESNRHLIDLVQSHADYVWTLVASALVFFMQAGFAMVETGFTRAKNAVNIMMKNLIDKTVGLRVSAEEELSGLDYIEHGGNAYPDFEILSYGDICLSTGGPGSGRTEGEPVGRLEAVRQT